jgi:hypothetical protein
MHTDADTGQGMMVNGRLRLFSLYVDYAASARARWANSAITKLAGPRWQSSTEMWSLGSLTAGESVRKMIASDAADADVLIIAATSLDQREPKLIEWLDSLAAWESNRPAAGLLVGLFGDEENRSKELEWTVRQFIYYARQMGRELVVQWMERDSMDDSGWLTQSVEALLACKQSACSETVLQEPAVDVA